MNNDVTAPLQRHCVIAGCGKAFTVEEPTSERWTCSPQHEEIIQAAAAENRALQASLEKVGSRVSEQLGVSEAQKARVALGSLDKPLQRPAEYVTPEGTSTWTEELQVARGLIDLAMVPSGGADVFTLVSLAQGYLDRVQQQVEVALEVESK